MTLVEVIDAQNEKVAQKLEEAEVLVTNSAERFARDGVAATRNALMTERADLGDFAISTAVSSMLRSAPGRFAK